MAVTLTTPNTILGVLEPKSSSTRLLTNLVTVVVGTALLTLSAKISVPTWPIPVTLQTFAVALLAAAFGWRIGLATVALYILEGLAGLPVFAGAVAGPAYLFGPTGGFILSWLLTAPIIGYAADRGASGKLLPLFGAMLLGDAVSFVIGFGWLATFLAVAKSMPAADAMAAAFKGAILPFVLWDILKMALAAVSTLGIWSVLKRRA